MNATLTFNDEERHELKMAVHASELYCALWNASDELRGLLKYRDDLAFTEKQEDALREIMADIQERLDICE